MLDVRHLEVSYGATQVLRDVSFSVEAGSIVALLGGNGSGKTTTLNVLSGLIAPQGGTVTLDGRRIDGLATDRVVALGLVQVPQGREVWGGMTVHDNLVLGAARRRDRRAIAADVEDMLVCFRRSGRSSARGPARSRVASSRCSPSAAPSWRARASFCSTSRRPGSRRWSSARSWTRFARSAPAG